VTAATSPERTARFRLARHDDAGTIACGEATEYSALGTPAHFAANSNRRSLKVASSLETAEMTTAAVTTERLHRYVLAASFAGEKRVVAIGERDAALLGVLARVARHVESVLPDPFSARLALPIEDASADLVVALTGLDRLADIEGLLREAKRILRGDGVLCAAFHATGGGARTAAEVADLLKPRFPSTVLYAQRHVKGSFVGPLGAPAGSEPAWFVRTGAGTRPGLTFDRVPAAFMALCSAVAVPDLASSTMFDEVVDAPVPEPIHRDRGGTSEDPPNSARRLRAELALREFQFAGSSRAAERIGDCLRHAERVAHERAEQLAAERAESAQSAHRLSMLQQIADQREREIATLTRTLQRTFVERDDALTRASTAEATLAGVLTSNSWRVTKPLRFLRRAMRGQSGGTA
jgi:SAM-dependent methyltransferase